MAILEVLVWPHKVLETRASEVTIFDQDLRRFVEDMHTTMQAAHGIGLAANQVGDLRRVITIHIPYVNAAEGEEMETRELWHDQKFTIINPVIIRKEGKFKYQEGCLSFPEIYEFIDRAAEIWVKAQDEYGKEYEIHATGLFAVCLQHEIDHIDGIVFFNRMSRLKAGMVKKKMLRRGSLSQIESV